MQPTFITTKQCCLYVVDTQERLMANIHEADRVAANICLMIRAAKTLKLPIFATTQYKKGIGPLIPEIAELLEGVPCPDKLHFNGLADAEVRKVLAGLPSAVDTLILCGVESHICVYQTAVGALRAGYQVLIVADGISSRSPANDRLGQERLRELGAVIAPAEMIIYELLQLAGTPAFKEILPFLK